MSENGLFNKECTNFFSNNDCDLIEQAIILVSQVRRSKNGNHPRGVDTAAFLMKFNGDAETVLAAILSDPVFNEQQPCFDGAEQFGETVASLVRDVNRLNQLHIYSPEMTDQPSQTEILRHMLLSIVKDVRAVLIKLSYRIIRLRNMAGENHDLRLYIAKETLDVYAPIANRLGINQIKWELEDLAFRYQQPRTYLKLVKALAETRIQREERINHFIGVLQKFLQKENIAAEITGRPKHLYSISKKMSRKQLAIDELYDLLALRVIVEKLTTCYAVLGVVHEHWQYIPKEFDDYIANPKSNGYQSLHIVVMDQQGHRFEVQIRTRKMHEYAELGVAAHWRYKEGASCNVAVDKNITSLRKLLNHSKDEQLPGNFKTDLFYDRIYVLSPRGKLIDLPRGSTPLDFAYAIHTQIGHRCRGAKVNGRIVPLTYQLQTGEQVEILTSKEDCPNQQWINSSLGYLKSPRAIAKVKNWIKQQNFDHNMALGRKLIDKIALQVGLVQVDTSRLAKHFNFDNKKKLMAAIGSGEITNAQLLNFLRTSIPAESPPRKKRQRNHCHRQQKPVVLVEGISNVKVTQAKCCKPQVDDDIIGYITHHNGISVHRQDCENISHLSRQKQTQLIAVSWAQI